MGGSIFQMRWLVVFDPFEPLHSFEPCLDLVPPRPTTLNDTRVLLAGGDPTRWSRGNGSTMVEQADAANCIEEIASEDVKAPKLLHQKCIEASAPKRLENVEVEKIRCELYTVRRYHMFFFIGFPELLQYPAKLCLALPVIFSI